MSSLALLSNPYFEAAAFAALLILGVAMLAVARGRGGRGDGGGGALRAFILLSALVFVFAALSILMLIFVNFVLPAVTPVPPYVSYNNMVFAVLMEMIVWVVTFLLFYSRLRGRRF